MVFRIAAVFECTNIPMQTIKNTIECDFMEKLFVKKPIARGHNIVKNADYDNLNLEKRSLLTHKVRKPLSWS